MEELTILPLINIPASLASKYVYENDAHDRLLSSSEGLDTDNIGDPVCKAGQTTGYTCGVITDTDAIMGTVNPLQYSHREASYSATRGTAVILCIMGLYKNAFIVLVLDNIRIIHIWVTS